jgi:3D (Asp-Asp-Asp) domain-containing protein
MHFVISRSTWRKVMAIFIAISGFVLLYEASIFDSRDAAGGGSGSPTGAVPGSRLDFDATAYCKGTTTASGVAPRTGIAAADPSILPVGSVINVTTDEAKYNGIYTIMDTGPKVQGRLLDVYMWSCHEALTFGRKGVQVTVLRLGWNPQASTPSLIDRLFRRREAARRNNPPAPAGSPPPAADDAPPGVDNAVGEAPPDQGSDVSPVGNLDSGPPATSGLPSEPRPDAPELDAPSP